jgi:hypothetical protein
MAGCISGYGIGAEMAHRLLVNLIFRYKINAQVRRLGANNHGHPWMHIIYRIQIRVQEIFNVLIYPRHHNALQFRGVQDFVAVGIGPLTYSSDYATAGDPLPCLEGDLLFIAKHMKLKCAPLPARSPEEIELYTRLVGQGPAKPTGGDWHYG